MGLVFWRETTPAPRIRGPESIGIVPVEEMVPEVVRDCLVPTEGELEEQLRNIRTEQCLSGNILREELHRASKKLGHNFAACNGNRELEHVPRYVAEVAIQGHPWENEALRLVASPSAIPKDTTKGSQEVDATRSIGVHQSAEDSHP